MLIENTKILLVTKNSYTHYCKFVMENLFKHPNNASFEPTLDSFSAIGYSRFSYELFLNLLTNYNSIILKTDIFKC